MSAGAIVTAVILLATFSFLYIVIGEIQDKYNEKANNMMSTDEYYSGTRREAMNSAFQVWYALPVAVIFFVIIFVVLKSVQDRTNTI